LDECLGRYAATIARFGCEKSFAVATSAARDVSNGAELEALGHKHGIPVHIISGAREAQLTFRGALCDRAVTDGIAVIDVGGGSTEIISEHDGVPRGTSVDVGSVRLTELFLPHHPVGADELARLRAFAANAFAGALPETVAAAEVVAVAGTPTTLAALNEGRAFDETFVHGYVLTADDIERWIGRLAALSVEEREKLPGMEPKRADVLVAGAAILAAGLRALDKRKFTVSTRGVRYGAALAWQEF
jgi:exopolyphosphatase/guanosine-5'-triphosphate,3'-diphosphate pyrophosphatase